MSLFQEYVTMFNNTQSIGLCATASTLFAVIAVLFSCNSTNSITSACDGDDCFDAADAGSDVDAKEEPYEPLADCVEPELVCPQASVLSELEFIELTPLAAANISLGDTLLTSNGPIVAWGADNCCANGHSGSGVANLYTLESALVMSPTAPEHIGLEPAFFERGETLSLLHTQGTTSNVVHIDPVNYEVTGEKVIPIKNEEGTVPAAVGVGQALFTITGPQLRMVALDSALDEKLLDTPIADAYSRTPKLIKTCHGMMAVWVGQIDMKVHAIAFDELGNQRSADQASLMVDTPFYLTANWDGKHVVVSVGNSIIELDTNANVTSTTTLFKPVLSAMGTDSGLVALVQGDLYTNPSIIQVERNTGEMLSPLGDLDLSGGLVNTASAIAIGRSIYFSVSTTAIRGYLATVRVECKKAQLSTSSVGVNCLSAEQRVDLRRLTSPTSR